MEMWDLYNEKRELVGIDHVRGTELPKNCYHLVVHVWIKNRKGQYLISQRSAGRPTSPLMWECVGGSVLKGENSIQGAVREVKEEVGVDLANIEGKIVFSKTRKEFNDILDVWLFEYDGTISLEQATTDEVVQTKWLYPEQIKEMYSSRQLVSTLEYFFDKINI